MTQDSDRLPTLRARGANAHIAQRAFALTNALVAWVLHPGSAWAETPFAERVQVVGRYFREAAEAGTFNGNVLVAREDEILLHEAHGKADFDLGLPLQIDHLFRIGSLTKPMTAAAVMRAAERDLLEFEDPLSRYFMACPAAWSGVTVRHLLTHTSGIPDLFGQLEAVPVAQTAAELERAVRSTQDHELKGSPGEVYEYSNFNYVLLGYVLEKASGALWEDFLTREVLTPLALSSTRYDDVYAVIPGRVRGYSRTAEGIKNIDYDDHAAYAAGGLLSTTSDLFHWVRALMTGRIVSPETLAEALRPNAGSYGYGWQIREFFERTIYNHTGGIDGFSAHLAYYPEDEWTIIVLSNVQSESTILRACDVAALLFEWRPIPPAFVDWEALEPRQRCGLER